ncbi:piriformospora indica-insensitive protein 2-like isoform X2 [Arachis ipaensis]|uniref:piriformospora indica-insensitive protein 2-like isoform X2 n=1 Tax=Arachis ipaensis TaxID=130454 RepID=UPI000A2B89B6|nr:piriformospora indica-insensitive protein 2-like isoform X2 [Arachis ipaensis]
MQKGKGGGSQGSPKTLIPLPDPTFQFKPFSTTLRPSRILRQPYEVDYDVAPMEKKEQEALYSTIQGFVGDSWNGSDLYPDPCGWTPIQGVSCDLFDGFWYVTVLNIGPIHDNSLVCAPNLEFRPQLFELRHLKSLSFFNCFQSPNKLPVSIPAGSWDKLAESLESLEFRSNKGLIGTIPSSFGVLKNLESLVLLENGLSGEIPTEIGSLIKLRRLVLAGNYFNGNIPDTFGGLKDLLIFDLSQNSLSGVLPSTLGSLTSALKIDVSHNNLEGNLPNEFANLKNLTLMDLRSNKFSGGLTLSLEEMCSLEEMVLSNNPLGGSINVLKWEKLKNLEVLELSNMGLIGEIPESISELKKLRFLGLSDNNLTGTLSPKLESLPSLNAIYLSGNNFIGELKFSKDFYGKLGRRFGAWNNPNLCYQIREMSSSSVPYGVKPCQQHQEEVNLVEYNSNSKILNGNVNVTSHNYISSMGVSSHVTNGLWCSFMETMLVMCLCLVV